MLLVGQYGHLDAAACEGIQQVRDTLIGAGIVYPAFGVFFVYGGDKFVHCDRFPVTLRKCTDSQGLPAIADKVLVSFEFVLWKT